MKQSSVSTMNHLIDFGVCALAGYTNFIILHNYLKRYFKCNFGVLIRYYIVRAQLLRERPKGKYSTDKQFNGPRGFEICIKTGNMSSFQMNPLFKPIFFFLQNLFPSGV